MSDSLFVSVQNQILKSYGYISQEYDRNLIESFLYPHKIITVYIPVQMDNGQTKIFVGYRSQHNNARGPYKGGIRYHLDVSQDEVMSLSARMSIKCSVVRIPLGGGKGGIVVDPKTLSDTELEKLSRGYIFSIYKIIGKDVDIPAPDVNTDSRIMAWMADEYSKLVGCWTPGVITGKPLASGGSLGRDIATSLGGLYVLQAYYQYKNKNLIGSKVVIQGAGNAGLNFAKLVVQEGAIVVGISDSSGGIYNQSGLDIDSIESWKNQHFSLSKYPNVSHCTNAELLVLPCDILVPAALEKQITIDNAHHIKAQCILELANGPTTAEANQILHDAHIEILPDVLSNAGGVTVSYFEQIQNNTNHYWSQEDVFAELKKIMHQATKQVLDISEKYQIDLRTSAYICSLRTILQSMKERGMK